MRDNFPHHIISALYDITKRWFPVQSGQTNECSKALLCTEVIFGALAKDYFSKRSQEWACSWEFTDRPETQLIVVVRKWILQDMRPLECFQWQVLPLWDGLRKLFCTAWFIIPDWSRRDCLLTSIHSDWCRLVGVLLQWEFGCILWNCLLKWSLKITFCYYYLVKTCMLMNCLTVFRMQKNWMIQIIV